MHSVSCLSNGMRIVCLPTKSQIELCGMVVDAGSRDEAAHEFGLAHFVEHTIFKGTKHRRWTHINKRMEAVGGELNAYTTKEDTIVYSVFPAGYLDRAAELLADLLTCPTFPEAEIEKERHVVCDEIQSYRDIPAEGIFDDFEDKIYAGSEPGHNILGTLDTVQSLTPEMCLRWVQTRFTPGRIVFFYAGRLAPERVFRTVERHFSHMHLPDAAQTRQTPATVAPFDLSVNLDCHQSHTVVGARIPGYMSELTPALALATNILGGPGMNSLLNAELRERRGLVYTIDASTSLLADSGLFTVYFGCDEEDNKRCRRLVADILTRLADTPLTPRRLDAAKRQLCGQLTVANANMENAVTSLARQLLHKGAISTQKESAERIYAVSADKLSEAVALLRPELCSALTFV